MAISRQEKMQILLEQIDLPKELIETHFNNSELKKLAVYKEAKRWDFHIQIDEILPVDVYKIFYDSLREAFSEIANVKLTTYCLNEEVNQRIVAAYFRHFIDIYPGLLPGQAELIDSQKVIFENLTIKLKARNEGEARSLEKRLNEHFGRFCEHVGLPKYKVACEVESSSEKIEEFRKQTAEEDRVMGEKVAQQQEKLQQNGVKKAMATNFALGSNIQDEPVMLADIVDEERRITVQGYVFSVDVRKLRSDRSLLIIKLTDYTDSLEVKMFSRNDEDAAIFEQAKKGMWIKARGRVQTDNYSNELTMMANDAQVVRVAEREDNAEVKRIELHAHTQMSQLDAVVAPGKLVEQAAKWGHKAVAITDHAVVQGFPEAYYASKDSDVKVIYGVEANVVDDGVPIAYNVTDIDLQSGTYVVFDVETTGLSSVYDVIIELAGVRVHNGEIIDRFESFANPHRKLSDIIIDITGITDDMLVDAPEIDGVLKDFHEWVGDDVLVAHNATFDIGFLNQGYKRIDYPKISNPVIDTLELARFLFPEIGNHRLNTLCKRLNIELTQHHRAIYDAEATGYLFWKLTELLLEKEITNINQLNDHMGTGDSYQRSRPFHVTLLVQNQEGLKNLYKLISLSHTDYFYRVPRMPRSLIEENREGLLIGSACDDGEIFETLMQKTLDEAEDVVRFYDYLEVQPPETYSDLVQRDVLHSEAQVLDILKNIVELGKRTDTPVVATGNVHHIDNHEKLYREILIASQKGNPLNRVTIPDTPFRTTNEMLEQFAFLGEELAFEIVVTNTHVINDKIEKIAPLPKGLSTPSIEGAEDTVRDITYDNARRIYGENLPEIIETRLERELNGIIGQGYAVIYLVSHQLVKRSLEDGYLVGSRGSVGSSLVATMMEITEVNPLPAHYVCLECHKNEFYLDGEFANGFDLPDKKCPNCNIQFVKEGQDIPFETFLGFEGEKIPDIDLNFSGHYQPIAHNYTRELFGEDYVFRAGTIGTIAERTAYGYVKGYASDKNVYMKNAEVDRLVQGCTGVKRTTGQHPGGIIVLPQGKEIYEFTPIQYPADDRKSDWKTTHFAFQSIEDNLLKLDILGHEDPTIIRMLEDLSGIDPQTIPTDDEEVMKIFSGTESLGVTPSQIDCKTGTLGVPEFGTSFVRQMLEDTKPAKFGELIIISGLSHGTDVWLGNAQELIKAGTCRLEDVIGCRDDIMVYLMQQGVDSSMAFNIMESVRRGRGLTEEWTKAMLANNVPTWYIESCKKIKYMFPKAHAAAYVLMAVRIAYFKVHHPILFYAAYFSIRAKDFELGVMIKGSKAIRERMNLIKSQGNDASPKEKNLLVVLEVALEMCERGFHFKKVDLYKSSATDFLVDGDGLIPPFNAVEGLGTNAAHNVVEAREDGEFLSKEDLRQRSRVSKTVIQYLNALGCLDGMEEENQLSLF